MSAPDRPAPIPLRTAAWLRRHPQLVRRVILVLLTVAMLSAVGLLSPTITSPLMCKIYG